MRPRSCTGWSILLAVVVAGSAAAAPAHPHRKVSGIHPGLAMFNDENECGTGAVVPWAGRLWVITYAPHKPGGSTDKLYEIAPDLARVTRKESVGGTPANRFIHTESGQLFIGPYVIDATRNVRVISPSRMPGRLTGTARHLTDPENRVYYATMEEGFYEVDVRTLDVRVLYPDANGARSHAGALLPGYHGKGLYSGQGVLVYANNGELSPEAQSRPDIESGCLAEWDGNRWSVVRRNQFTEVTGPGGIRGSSHPETDPIWSMGWDHRSLLLLMRHRGGWHTYRLPKSSHSYDGAHGWNTEWPRIRDVGGSDLLMTMHGAFWRFPRRFAVGRTGGIQPRSNYLKVVGDFARWDDEVVLGCDDAARSEFLNRRKAKGTLAPPGRSHSNLWFARPSDLDRLGPVIGRGTVWTREDVWEGQVSDPFLFSGYDHRTLHLVHEGPDPVRLRLELDRHGNGRWQRLRDVVVRPESGEFVQFRPDEQGAWVRLVALSGATRLTAAFAFRDMDPRSTRPDAMFAGLAGPGDMPVAGGLLHAGGGERPVLRFRSRHGSMDPRLYQLDEGLRLRFLDDPRTSAWMATNAAIPQGVLAVDAASVIYRDDRGTWRLPRGDEAFDLIVGGTAQRVCREVCTERDLFNAHGTFYELPAENAGGFARIRPIATHNRLITDYASYRGLLVLSGVVPRTRNEGDHVVVSEDGQCALWVGSVEDLWKLGKPRGVGGPWKETPVQPWVASDPYLMTGYDRKRLRLAHDLDRTVEMQLEVDITGDGLWVLQSAWVVPAGRGIEIRLPEGLSAYWARLRCSEACIATGQFTYE